MLRLFQVSLSSGMQVLSGCPMLLKQIQLNQRAFHEWRDEIEIEENKLPGLTYVSSIRYSFPF